MHIYLLIFLLQLLLSALFINGFYNITRGRWVTNPDGKKEWVGKIFSWYSKFLQQHRVVKEYFIGPEFLNEFLKIRNFFKEEHIIEYIDNGVVIQEMSRKRIADLVMQARVAGTFISISSIDEGKKMLLMMYREKNEYKFPNWVRAPLGECLACMSSFWGTFCWIFWSVSLDTFSKLSTVSKTELWIVFCISLAYINELIFSINNKLSR